MANKFTIAVAGMTAELATEPQWQPYAEYLEIRAGGTYDKARKDACERAAESFVEIARHWPYKERKRFSLWLMERAGQVAEQIGGARNSSRGREFVSLNVVIEKILLPMLREWRGYEPSNPEPHFWEGLYSFLLWDPNRHPVTCLKEALLLDFAYAPAREALARHILDAISYNQHELPSGYLHDTPEDDLASLREVEELLAEPVDLGVRDSLQERIAALRNAAEEWIKRRRKKVSEPQR